MRNVIKNIPLSFYFQSLTLEYINNKMGIPIYFKKNFYLRFYYRDPYHLSSKNKYEDVNL